MSEEFGNDFITITDDNGEEYELEHLDTIEHKEETFMVFGAEDSDDPDSVEVVIFKVVEENGEELFEAIEDEALMNEVFDLFEKRQESLDE